MADAALALAPSELVLGRYRPIRPLGSGGSGSVWLARDEQTGLEVALKMVPREGKGATRAEREAETAARLRHERCLRAYGFGHDDAHVYIAYEYVPGRTLRQALRAGELDDRRLLEAGAQILDGLAHAHAHGIVHRDVKPSNVQLRESDGIDVRILDFGLAQVQEAETLTAAGDVPGTLAYISPERLRGHTATPAADVWAVGVLLWEGLAGWHPFWSSSLLDTARKIQEGAPPLSTTRPDLPDGLCRAIDLSLSVEPGERPSAPELAATLRRAFLERDRRRKPQKGRARAGGQSGLDAVRSERSRLAQGPVRPLVAPRGVRVAVSSAFAGLAAGWVVATLPFFPTGFALGAAALAAALMATMPRIGLAFVLATPVLPLGNASLGLAIVYTCLAACWLLLFLGAPRAGVAAILGPLLAPISALGLLPLLVQGVNGRIRRAATVVAAVALAAVWAGIAHHALPLAGGSAPPLGVDGESGALGVASRLSAVAGLERPLWIAAAVLAAAAVLLPNAVRAGIWGIAAWGAALIVVPLAADPHVHAVPLVVTTWLTCLVLVLWREPRLRRRLRQRPPAVPAAPAEGS